MLTLYLADDQLVEMASSSSNIKESVALMSAILCKESGCNNCILNIPCQQFAPQLTGEHFHLLVCEKNNPLIDCLIQIHVVTKS